MKIINIKFENFKNLKDNSYSFKDINIIKGKNGAGKSTIRDAVLFVFYNTTSDGGKNTEKYISKGETYCKVEIETDKGIYTRAKSFTSTDFLKDNVSITQKDVDLPDIDIFNSVFLIGYFNTLSDKEKRKLILNTTERLDPEKLFIEVYGKKEWIKKYKLDLSNTEDAIKKLNKIKKETEINNYENSGKLKLLDKYSQDFTDANAVKQEILQDKDKNTLLLKELEIAYKAVNQIEPLEIRKKSEELLNTLKDNFGEVELVLSETYKTKADIKDVFRFEFNGLDYNQLSTGEKLRVDIIISQFFNGLLKEPIDMYFIDETSLLDAPISAIEKGQTFATEITPYDLEIISE